MTADVPSTQPCLHHCCTLEYWPPCDPWLCMTEPVSSSWVADTASGRGTVGCWLGSFFCFWDHPSPWLPSLPGCWPSSLLLRFSRSQPGGGNSTVEGQAPLFPRSSSEGGTKQRHCDPPSHSQESTELAPEPALGLARSNRPGLDSERMFLRARTMAIEQVTFLKRWFSAKGVAFSNGPAKHSFRAQCHCAITHSTNSPEHPSISLPPVSTRHSSDAITLTPDCPLCQTEA